MTISDVAKAAGVSISTVSKVINNSPRISVTTKNKVKAIMEEMNFHPNSIARNFAKQHSRNICIIKGLGEGWDAVSNPYLYEIINGIEYVAQEADYLLSIINVDTESDIWMQLKKYIMEKRIDSFLIFASLINQKLVRQLQLLNFPFLIIGEVNKQTTASWVDLNNEIAGQQAVQHLVEMEKREIIFLCGTDDNIGEKRLRGVLNYIQSHSIKKVHVKTHFINTTIDAGSIFFKKIQNEGKNPDAIICSSSIVAAGLLRALKDSKIEIPQHIAVISFDKYPLSQYTSPTLTVVDMNLHELGVQCGKTMFEVLKNPQLIIQNLITASSLNIGGSTVSNYIPE